MEFGHHQDEKPINCNAIGHSELNNFYLPFSLPTDRLVAKLSVPRATQND